MLARRIARESGKERGRYALQMERSPQVTTWLPQRGYAYSLEEETQLTQGLRQDCA
jgi:hypothetical protein